MKRVPFFCQLPKFTQALIKTRARTWSVPQWQVIAHAIATSTRAPFDSAATYANPKARRAPKVKSIKITHGGTCYTTKPTFIIVGGAGMGATATSVVKRNGKYKRGVGT